MPEHHVFDENYVLTAIPNAFNGKTGWWLSKRDHTLSMYCFSTFGSKARQEAEMQEQTKGIDGYIRAYEDLLKRLRRP